MKTKPFMIIQDNQGMRWYVQYMDGTHFSIFDDLYNLEKNLKASVLHIGQLIDISIITDTEKSRVREWLRAVGQVDTHEKDEARYKKD